MALHLETITASGLTALIVEFTRNRWHIEWHRSTPRGSTASLEQPADPLAGFEPSFSKCRATRRTDRRTERPCMPRKAGRCLNPFRKLPGFRQERVTRASSVNAPNVSGPFIPLTSTSTQLSSRVSQAGKEHNVSMNSALARVLRNAPRPVVVLPATLDFISGQFDTASTACE
jgi:hypothetical protein